MRAYTYGELAAIKAQVLDICEQVRRDNPTAWRQAHDGSFSDRSRRFNDLCVQALRAVGIFAGMNGKRGDRHSRSDDVLAFGLQAGQGGAQDKGGTFAEMAIVDFIGGAGGPNPTIGWSDVSKAAPGIFLEPEYLPRVDGEPSAPAPSPAPTPAPGPQPAPPSTDLSAIKAQLATALDLLGVVLSVVSQSATAAQLEHLRARILDGGTPVPSVLEHIDDAKRIAAGVPRDERFLG